MRKRQLVQAAHGDAATLDSGRRGFLGWMGKIGVGAVGVAAGIGALQKPAAAATWRCCNLAFGQPNCPINSSGSAYCRKGSMKVWYCCTGSRKYACGECTGGSSCGSGPFYCSAGWTVRANSC
ncbi:hypothetical protein [Actinomadura violacea]|uniref:Twin-arginine translocation signal domain-containing protein n=1 Tax=Actinomadura violacea TaxID=2819934 RepID=A0ABS3RQH7_9ACTN|nr:hypothetical protein [Actinomadura violacea]MBO2459001.1 hypothetical protein [Actinomadura violacea]